MCKHCFILDPWHKLSSLDQLMDILHAFDAGYMFILAPYCTHITWRNDIIILHVLVQWNLESDNRWDSGDIVWYDQSCLGCLIYGCIKHWLEAGVLTTDGNFIYWSLSCANMVITMENMIVSNCWRYFIIYWCIWSSTSNMATKYKYKYKYQVFFFSNINININTTNYCI